MNGAGYGDNRSNSSVVNDTVSWDGMTPGYTYEVQIWVEDLRSYGLQRTESFTGGNLSDYGPDTSGFLQFQTGSGKGQFITGTFVADSSGTETIGITPESTGSVAVSQINTLLVETVATPEPTTLVLAGLGGAGLLLFRKRR